jgi:superfamily II DNA or RNA helicase
MAMKGIKYDGIKRLYKRKPFGAETFIGYMNYCYKTFKKYSEQENKILKLELIDHRDKNVMKDMPPFSEKLNIPYKLHFYQTEAVMRLLKHRWGICEIGTGGGISFIISLFL